MNLDLNAIFNASLCFISAIDPTHAAIGAAILFFVQHFASGKGFKLADLLDTIKKVIGKQPAAPAPDSGPKTDPSVPSVPMSPIIPGMPDLLANRPVLKTARDLLLAILAQKFSDKVATAQSHDEIIQHYQTFTDALEGRAVKIDPAVTVVAGK